MEEETKKMEVRLQELKLAMENERQQRAVSGNPGFWSRGQAGALTNYKSVSAGAKKPAPPSSGPPPAGSTKAAASSVRKVKLIKDEPINLPDRTAAAAAIPGTLAHLANRGAAVANEDSNAALEAVEVAEVFSAAGGGAPRCGQCEDRAAAVLCPECAEEYCASRSARIFPLERQQQLLHRSSGGGGGGDGVFEDTSRQTRRNMVRQLLHGDEGESSSSTSEAMASNGGGALLTGEVDERQNAEEFRRALAEWRSGGGGEAQKPTAEPAAARKKPAGQQQRQQPRQQTSSHGTATEDDNGGRLSSRLEIKFTSSLSYAEQLLLQKHRRADVGKMPSYQGESSGANDTFEEIRSMQRQQKELAETPRSSGNDLERLPARTNRTKIDDMFPAQLDNADEAAPPPDDEEETPRAPPTPSESGSRPGTARSQRQQQRRRQQFGLEWQRPKTPAGSGRSSATPRKQQQHKLTAAATGGLSALLARQSMMSTMESSSSQQERSFLMMGVEDKSANATSSTNATRRQGNVAPWSSGDSRPSSAASSRPSSALSNRFYALSGRQSWRPDASLRSAGLDAEQLLRTRAEADRLLMSASSGQRPDSGRMQLEDVEIETEARVLAAMPLSRPVSARTERQRLRASAAAASRVSNGDRVASMELDVTADYLQDDVEHLSRLAIELATREEPEESNADEMNHPAVAGLVGRELTQEDKERQLQEWDDSDMDRMDTERYDDRDEVRQLH
uniref:RING-type domain-containing protein n=1 Tax=Macrostomum lignano TaxID=282301 RepID=A0A1I8FX39_9PLAT